MLRNSTSPELFPPVKKPKWSKDLFQDTNAIYKVQLTLMSPEERLRQLQRTLPNESKVGEVLNSQTLNYKTLKPERNGLFCERTFGPVQSFTCACEKKQKSHSIKFCPECEVEFTSSKVRRYRLGYIRLGTPVAHIWYLKGRPSYIALLLDMKKRHAESIAYGTTCIFNNYQINFATRIHQLRKSYDRSFSIKRKWGYYHWTKEVFLPGINIKEQNKTRYQILRKEASQTADDFWIPTIRNVRRIVKYPSPDTWLVWRKRRFTKFKPFYQVPMMRDHFNIPYRLDPYHLFHLERYLLPLVKRKFAVPKPIPKYKRVIDHSMICDPNSKNLEILLTGGLAFQHLFSKIDCCRMFWSLHREMRTIRDRLDYFHLKEEILNRDLNKDEMREFEYLTLKQVKTVRRMKLFRMFWKTGSRPEWMFISVLPILPPDLRPIIKLGNDQLAISDLNRLYQYIFHRNKNTRAAITAIYKHLGIAKVTADEYFFCFQAFRYSTSIVCFQQKLLQQAVDALLENGKGGSKPVCGSNDRPLKSLSDILKGKKGRFRLNLLGKRVDYSGRSVIVVGPTLKLHQCGLPKEIAIELFQSVLIRKILTLQLAKTAFGAKQLIRKEHPIIWSLLNELMNSYPVLLNRAPTLHRLGVQAFLPKLIRGKAILLHPLVCPAFNADFDGDQMGVHLPLTTEAKAEAWTLMLSTQNVLSPATGEPILTPSQDMVLGCYYLTKINPRYFTKQNYYFSNFQDVYKAYLNRNLHPHQPIWLKWPDEFYSTQDQVKTLEIRLRRFSRKIHETLLIATNKHETFLAKTDQGLPLDYEGNLKDRYLRTTVGRVIINKEFEEKVRPFAKSQSTFSFKLNE